jgi:hypothetical protein
MAEEQRQDKGISQPGASKTSGDFADLHPDCCGSLNALD